MKLDQVVAAIQMEKGKTREAYETTVGEFYIDISPTERLFFADIAQDDWETDKEFAVRMETRRAEIAAALVKFAASMQPALHELSVDQAVSLGLLD